MDSDSSAGSHLSLAELHFVYAFCLNMEEYGKHGNRKN